MNMTTAWNKMLFILSGRSNSHMTDNLSTAVHACASHVFMSSRVDETQLPTLVNLSTSFKEPPFRVEMSLRCIKFSDLSRYKQIHSILGKWPGQVFINKKIWFTINWILPFQWIFSFIFHLRSENKGKWKNKQILGRCLWTKKKKKKKKNDET